MSFWDAYDFWRDSVLAVLLSGAVCAYLGVYVVLRRVVFVGAALTQISGVGIALAFWLAAVAMHGDPHQATTSLWFSPQLYSLAAAVLGALLFSFNRGGQRIASETVVGLGWIIAAASVLLILSSPRIVAEAHEVDDLLYGTAVLVRPAELETLALVVASLLLLHLVFYRTFVFLTYDGEFAQTLGIRAPAWDMLLYVTLGVGISFAVRTVGALPAFGFLVIPPAAAQLLVRRVVWAFPLSVLFALLGGGLGYYVAFTRQVPTGAAIVATSAVFLVPGLMRRAFWRTS
jgi:zinc transport system permease protein